MIIKTTYKSHFFLKKKVFSKNIKKRIFNKNIILFILFSKIFFKKYKLNVLYLNKKIDKFNILKAPSRHKKFFHQVFTEYFCIKFIWFIQNNKQCCGIDLFEKLNFIFLKIGTNTLSRFKFKLIFLNTLLNTNHNNLL